jgi:hypothetical protein
MRFSFYDGPWENSESPTIVREDPEGGDPHILAVLIRIHNPDALYELCRLANAHQVEPQRRFDDWKIENEGGLPAVQRHTAAHWITWSPSISSFGCDTPRDELLRQADIIRSALQNAAPPEVAAKPSPQ